MIRKHLLCLLIWLLPLTAPAAYPDAVDNYVNDFAGVIDAASLVALRQNLGEFETATGIEMVIVTIEKYTAFETGSVSWEHFVTGLFNIWGIGNLPENNGVLILVSTKDRKVRIELGKGYSDQYDAKIQSAVDTMTPFFAAGGFSAGLSAGVEETKQILRTDFFWSDLPWLYILGGLAFFSVAIALYGKEHKKNGMFWVVFGVVGLLIILLVHFFWNSVFSSDGDTFGGGSSDGGGGGGDF
jgi:uncharacterized protein